MAEDIFESLIEVGYKEIKQDNFEQAVIDGSKSIHFTKLIEWLTKELQILYSLDEHVNAITTSDDSSSFLMELSSFLKEIGCHYSLLMEGHINERLHSNSNKLLLLDYLLTELKSARMIQFNEPDNSLQVTIAESSTAIDLKKILMNFGFPKPPANIPPKVLFAKVEQKLKEIISELPFALYGEPLFTGQLSDEQWYILDAFYKELFSEYRIRREMLLKRLDVTIQSFEWADHLKTKSNEIKKSFQSVRNAMNFEPYVRLSDILAARKDLAILEKTSSASVRRKTKSEINKVMIGNVPDRGGRPYEQEPPPPEMPSWKQRNNTPMNLDKRDIKRKNNFESGNTRKNYDTSNEGRVQAGWNQSQNFQNQYESRYKQYKNTENYSQQSSYYSNYGNNSSVGYQQAQGSNHSYERQFSNTGSNPDKRRGEYQNYGVGNQRNYQDYQNKDGSRNYYRR